MTLEIVINGDLVVKSACLAYMTLSSIFSSAREMLWSKCNKQKCTTYTVFHFTLITFQTLLVSLKGFSHISHNSLSNSCIKLHFIVASSLFYQFCAVSRSPLWLTKHHQSLRKLEFLLNISFYGELEYGILFYNNFPSWIFAFMKCLQKARGHWNPGTVHS